MWNVVKQLTNKQKLSDYRSFIDMKNDIYLYSDCLIGIFLEFFQLWL